MYILIIPISALSVILTMWASRGQKDPDVVLTVLFSAVPVLGWILGAVAVGCLYTQNKDSNGKCTFGHDFKKTMDSESIKDKYRAMGVPIMCSMGGTRSYTCTRCNTKQIETWKAF